MAQNTWKRSKDGAIVAGVCKGYANAYNVNVDAVRLITVLIFLISSGTALLVYLILALALPLDTNPSTTTSSSTPSNAQKAIPKKDDDEYAFDPEDYKI